MQLKALAVTASFAAVVGTSVLGIAPAATSAGDTTPPTLSTPAKASFTVGGQIDLGSASDCGDDPHDIRVDRVPVELAWTGSDASGQVRYAFTQETGRDGPVEVFSDSDRTSYAAAVGSNDDQWCGGGSPSIYQWDVDATDPSGNLATHQVYGGRIRLTQDTNHTDDAGYATVPTIAYQGRWGTSRCACWSDGGVHRTSVKGASFTVTTTPFTSFPGDLTNHHVGLVMHQGPDRGRFQVYVDGRLRSTVDLAAATSQPRMIVWQTAFKDFGHTIRVVNLATPGRPRIDLDAVLTN